MKLKKIFVSLIAAVAVAFAGSTSLHAEDTAGELKSLLMIHLHSGSIDKYILSDTPEVTFEGEDLVVNSSAAQTSYGRSDVSHFEIKKDWYSAVEETPAEALAADFTLKFTDNATVEVTASALTRVDLYTVAGVKVAAVAADGGVATVSVADLAPGVYIVAPDCHPAVKIVKR